MLPKPKDYSYYQSKKNGIPFRDWPQECKDYKNYLRVIRVHPEWEECTLEELYIKQQESKSKRAAMGRRAFRVKWANMPQEDKDVINKKKGSFYHKMSLEKKLEHNKVLQQRSRNFWDAMSPKERAQFSQYRESKLTEEQKQQRVERGIQHLMGYTNTLTPEDIQQQVKRLNAARKKKLEENPVYREEQTKLLRLHNREYFDNITPEERDKVLHHNKLNERFERQFKDSILSNDFYLHPEFLVKLSDRSFKIWDYAIYSKKDNSLVVVVDLDGEYYHAITSDYNGLQSKEERDEKRGEFVPEGTKVCIIEETNFLDSFRELMKTTIEDFESYMNDLFMSYRNIEFPFPMYSNKQLIESYKQLVRLNVHKDHMSLNIRNREGDMLIQHFHHSIWFAHTSGNPSPFEAWYDDKLLYKCIQNRTLYRSTLNPNKVLQGFNISKIAPKVSVFSAGRAKLIIDRYLSGYDLIFDPFSGFSGRMLGAISLGKAYIGQDISFQHISESRKMLDFLHKPQRYYPDLPLVSLECKDVNDSYGTYPCLFTCPPYANKEIWTEVPESNLSCDDWIDICVNHFKCQRYVFVVDCTERYKEFVVDMISNKSHFGTNHELLIVIDKHD